VPPEKSKKFATESATLPKLAQADLATPSDQGLPPIANLLAPYAGGGRKPLVYCLGAGWSKRGGFPEETDGENYVRQFAARFAHP